MNMNQVVITDKHTIEAMKQLAPALANKAIEIALAEQATQDQFITADEARALGAGNFEVLCQDGKWWTSTLDCPYRETWMGEVIKYRAIRKEVPAEPTFSGLKKVSTEKLAPAWQKLLHDNLWELYESDKPAAPHANLVKLDGKFMTREAAITKYEVVKDTKELWCRYDELDWAELIDVIFWLPDTSKLEYQLRPKAKKSVSLDPAIREGVIALLQELNFIK